MNAWTRAVSLLPESFQNDLAAQRDGEELRLRIGRTPRVLTAGKERSFSNRIVTSEALQRVLEKATGASLHAVTDALREGYISCRGLRIGVCGVASAKGGGFEGFRAVSSLAIRVPHEQRGICEALWPRLFPSGYQNTLIVSPPGFGKTTFLREMIRCLSEEGRRVAVVDERNELSASDGEGTQFDLGPCSDVLVGISKQRACPMLLRGMNPQILAMDEISEESDLYTVRQIIGCGVGLLATAHATSAEDLTKRSLYRELLRDQVFAKLVVISMENDQRQFTVQALP